MWKLKAELLEQAVAVAVFPERPLPLSLVLLPTRVSRLLPAAPPVRMATLAGILILAPRMWLSSLARSLVILPASVTVPLSLVIVPLTLAKLVRVCLKFMLPPILEKAPKLPAAMHPVMLPIPYETWHLFVEVLHLVVTELVLNRAVLEAIAITLLCLLLPGPLD